MNKLDLNEVIKNGNKGFKLWWFPLCAVSAILLFTNNFLPSLIASNFEEMSLLTDVFEIIKRNFENLSQGHSFDLVLDRCINQLNIFYSKTENILKAWALFYKVMLMFSAIGIIAMVFQIATLIFAKASITEKKDLTIKRDFSRIIILSFSYSLLSFIKGFAFVFLIIPGIYLYVKLYFTGFLILEKSANPFSAMKKSWQMTEGNFWQITLLFLITLGVNIISGITLIGFIPGNSYNYALRAAAYKKLK